MIASKAETAAGTLAYLAEKYGGARGYARSLGLSDGEVRAPALFKSTDGR
jgi:hypothetical protein